MGSPFLEGGTFVAVVFGIMMMGTGPCKEDKKAGCDPDEVGRARTFFLVRPPLVLVGPLSRAVRASTSCSACSELVCK